MRFICNKSDLTNAVNIVQKAALSNSTSPVLMGILLEAKGDTLSLTCNNLEIAICNVIPAQVDMEGSVVVKCSLFSDIIRKVDGDLVHINVNENMVANIVCGGSNYDISGFKIDEFPVLPVVDKKSSVTITKRQLKDLIKCTTFAAGISESKLILTGCLVEIKNGEITMVAVDGFRLAIRTIKTNADTDASFVIPAKSLNELSKIIEDSDDNVEIIISDKNICFVYDGVKFVSRLLEGDYIPYEKIIPSDFKTIVKVRSAEFERAVERASLIVTNEISKGPLESPLIIEINEGGLEMSCENQLGKSEERIFPSIDGEALKIGFNHKYLLDAVKVCPEDEYFIGFGSPQSPCLIYPADGNNAFKYIVVPVKLRG
ncbi:MAG: DNA polymerase III subunit beta [Eubacteriales bacterium]|nr:DNA polymerase III subunit beta [Eubacteriales bacterium]